MILYPTVPVGVVFCNKFDILKVIGFHGFYFIFTFSKSTMIEAEKSVFLFAHGFRF